MKTDPKNLIIAGVGGQGMESATASGCHRARIGRISMARAARAYAALARRTHPANRRPVCADRYSSTPPARTPASETNRASNALDTPPPQVVRHISRPMGIAPMT